MAYLTIHSSMFCSLVRRKSLFSFHSYSFHLFALCFHSCLLICAHPIHLPNGFRIFAATDISGFITEEKKDTWKKTIQINRLLDSFSQTNKNVTKSENKYDGEIFDNIWCVVNIIRRMLFDQVIQCCECDYKRWRRNSTKWFDSMWRMSRLREPTHMGYCFMRRATCLLLDSLHCHQSVFMNRWDR